MSFDPAVRRGFCLRDNCGRRATGLGVASGVALHYANGMIKSLLLALLLVPALAQAVICKSVDAEGVVSYTDVPAGECGQEVKLPDYSRYAPRPIQRRSPGSAEATGSEMRFERYQTMSIVEPEQNGTVRSNDGQIAVAVDLQPDLQAGHKVVLLLDGRKVDGEFGSLNIQLSGVERGSHMLRAQVVDARGATLIASSSVRFTLRKLGLNDPGSKPEQPIEPGKPPYQPPGTPDYRPPAGGSYAPGGSSGPISTTPGQTNPAFTPKYGR